MSRQVDYSKYRDAPGMTPMRDSPVLRAVLSPVNQVEQEAASKIADKLLGPGGIHKKYPMGWLTAPYVKLPAQIAVLFSNEHHHS